MGCAIMLLWNPTDVRGGERMAVKATVATIAILDGGPDARDGKTDG